MTRKERIRAELEAMLAPPTPRCHIKGALALAIGLVAVACVLALSLEGETPAAIRAAAVASPEDAYLRAVAVDVYRAPDGLMQHLPSSRCDCAGPI